MTVPRDPARIADFCILLAFVAVLVSPLHSVPRFCSYVLAFVVLCRPRVWRFARQAPIAWLAALLIGYLLLTTAWAEAVEPALGVRFGIRGLVLVCFVAAFADCVYRGDAAHRIGRWFAVAAGGAACLAIAGFYLQPPEMGRLLGPGQIQNELIASQAFTVGALFAVHALLRPQVAAARVWPWLFAASATAMIAAVALTGARTGWLALAVGFGVLVLAHRTPNRFWAWAALWVAAIFALLAVLVWHEGAREWLLPRGASYRLLIWEQVLAQALEAPWFGNGLLADDNLSTPDGVFLHPHSVYLSLFHQGGLVGLGLFAALIGATAVALSRQLRRPDACLALALLAAGAVVALLDGHQLIHKVGVVWWLFWLPVATAIGLAARKPTAPPRTNGGSG